MRGRLGAAMAVVLCCAVAACRSAPAEEPWIELFDGRSLGAFVATEFGGEGEVAVRDGAIQLGMGSPLTGITWTGPVPTGDYELEVTAARLYGSDFFCGVTFPVADSHLTLVLGGWSGSVCGLSSLDGLDAAHNATRTLRGFTAGRNYRVRITVTAAHVAVRLDDEPFLAASLAGRMVGLRPEMLLSRPLGLASFATAASVSTFRWRPLPPQT